MPLHYRGFDIGNEFVIGCGLDYQERYRNLPVIATFVPPVADVTARTSGRAEDRVS